jgi:hypothetical protein
MPIKGSKYTIFGTHHGPLFHVFITVQRTFEESLERSMWTPFLFQNCTPNVWGRTPNIRCCLKSNFNLLYLLKPCLFKPPSCPLRCLHTPNASLLGVFSKKARSLHIFSINFYVRIISHVIFDLFWALVLKENGLSFSSILVPPEHSLYLTERSTLLLVKRSTPISNVQ